jgi:hypothetical protein
MSPNRPALICKQKTDRPGRWQIVLLAQSCRSFYPSSTFSAGSDAVRRIPLTRGKFALVDADDYYRLVKFKWTASSKTFTSYACGVVAGRKIKMHRFIMDAPAHLLVDHIDHDGLNNTKANLRLCTPAQNTYNIRSLPGGTSKYKGVHWHKKGKKWNAIIKLNGKQYNIGFFADEIEAAKAYDKKAAQLQGEFACLNFPSAAEAAS